MMNYSTLKKTVAFTLATAFALVANAQDKPSATTTSAKVFGGRGQYRTWTVGINGGFTVPAVLTGGQNDFNKGVGIGEYTFKPYYGINLRKQLAHSFGLQGDLQMGKVQGYNKNGALTVGTNGGGAGTVGVNAFETTVGYDLSLSGVVNVATIDFIRRENKINFYVSAGYGLMGYAPKGYSKYSTNSVVYDWKGKAGSSGNKTYVKQAYIPVGMGIKFKLGDRVALDLGYTMKFIDADNFDGIYSYNNYPSNDKFSYTHAGLEFSLGSKSKPDLNWVNPVAMMYDELKDPTLRQEVEALKGRVTNLEQSVEDLKKDTDGDGVSDQFDKCPNTPAGAKVDGSGCELDTDGDGIPDWKDKCPTEKGTVALNGCPEVDNSNMLKDVSTIQFEFNSSVLRTSSYPTLDKVSSMMRAKSSSMLQLDGHASAEGTDAYNMQLSIDRANAVKTYLVNSGVDAKNIATKGYGETRPIASNATEEGRIANRRVEFRQQ
jgi:OOP family OmpA-OmpF porin